MADLTAIRNALAATITANTNPPVPCVGIIQSQVNPPMAYVRPQPGQLMTFDTLDGGAAFMGAVTYRLIVTLVCSYTEDQSSQATLDAMLSTNEAGSVINAISQNGRLGGAVDDAVVTTVTGYGLRLINDIQYLCSDVHVTVMASTP